MIFCTMLKSVWIDTHAVIFSGTSVWIDDFGSGAFWTNFVRIGARRFD